MAKTQEDRIEFETPEQVWQYYTEVNCYGDSELEDDVKDCIEPLMKRFSNEEIRKVIEYQAGKNLDKMVLFDLNYFTTVLEGMEAKEQLESQSKGEDTTDFALKVMKEAMIKCLQDTEKDGIVAWAKKVIEEELGPIKRVMKIITPDKKEVKGVLHEKFDEVSNWISVGENVMLTGPAGSGKNILAEQIAKAFDLEYFQINSPQQKFEFCGFNDANGNFVDTPFTRFVKAKKALMVIDEMDGMNPEVGVVINDALSSKKFTFPDGTTIDFSKNHYFIGCGNTWGTGATSDYVGRNQLDAATLNRWQTVFIDYSPTIEEFLCEENQDLLEFIREFRRNIQNNNVHHIVSYRNLSALAKMFKNFPDCNMEDVLKEALVKNLEPNDLSVIARNMTTNDKYTKIIKRMAEEY